MTELRKHKPLRELVGKPLVDFVWSKDQGRIALMFGDDACIEVYAFVDEREAPCLSTQQVIWSAYNLTSMVAAGVVTAADADQHDAQKSRLEETKDRAAYERLKEKFEREIDDE